MACSLFSFPIACLFNTYLDEGWIGFFLVYSFFFFYLSCLCCFVSSEFWILLLFFFFFLYAICGLVIVCCSELGDTSGAALFFFCITFIISWILQDANTWGFSWLKQEMKTAPAVEALRCSIFRSLRHRTLFVI